MGELVVSVVSAENLRNTDTGLVSDALSLASFARSGKRRGTNLSDPFVVLTCGGMKRKTDTVQVRCALGVF